MSTYEWGVYMTKSDELSKVLYGNTITDNEEISNLFSNTEYIKLLLFFKDIEKYASDNHIYPIRTDIGCFYRVRLDEIGLEIGYDYVEDTSFHCDRVIVENEEDFINFNDILTNKKQNNIDKISKNLELLSMIINDCYNDGTPIEAIDNTCSDTIKKLKKKI